MGEAINKGAYATEEDHERTLLIKLFGDLDHEGVLIKAVALRNKRPFSNSSKSKVSTFN